MRRETNSSALEIFKSKQEVFKFAVNRCSTKNYFCLCVSPSYKQHQENFDVSQALWMLERTVLILSSLNSSFSTCIHHRKIWVNCILLMFPPQIRQIALFPNYLLTEGTIFPGINQEAMHWNEILTAFFWMWKLVPAKTRDKSPSSWPKATLKTIWKYESTRQHCRMYIILKKDSHFFLSVSTRQEVLFPIHNVFCIHVVFSAIYYY